MQPQTIGLIGEMLSFELVYIGTYDITREFPLSHRHLIQAKHEISKWLAKPTEAPCQGRF
jgi:hypothetical protein